MGGLDRCKAECRDQRRIQPIDNLTRDVRHAFRAMRRSPGFTAVAVLSLALGIGANSAMFQLLAAIGLRSLPVARPHELAEVRIAGGNQGFGLSGDSNSQLTNPLWEQVREHQQAFSGVFAWGTTPFLIGRGGDVRTVNGLWVSGTAFTVLGVRPALGRLFTSDDDRRGCGAQAAVISDRFWRAGFGGAPSVVGTTMPIMGRPVPIVGVTPPSFFGLEVGRQFDVALPICAAATWGNSLDQRHVFWLTVMGRLQAGWTLARAAEQMNAISAAVFDATIPPGYSAASTARYRSFRLTALTAERGVSDWRTRYEQALWLLLATTGLVLLIACANISNLMLARSMARERELAVRVAMGASRGRLVAQTLTESALLAIAGTAAGTIVARTMSRGLVLVLSTARDSLDLDLALDYRVFVFSATVAAITCLAFGLLPALRSSLVHPLLAMQSGGRGATMVRHMSLQRAMVAGQIAVSLVLLAGALLFVRSFRNLTNVDTGLHQDGVVLASFAPMDGPRRAAAQILAFEDAMLGAIRSIPGVAAASASVHFPLIGGSWTQGFRIPAVDGEQARSSKFTYVSPEYFRTFEIPMLAGRDFNAFDTATSPGVVVVNETFVRRYVPSSRPIGLRLRTTPEPGYPEALYEIVGIVKDAKYGSLREEAPPETFVPLTQHPNLRPWPGIVIRAVVPPPDVIAEVKRRVAALDPAVAMGFQIFETEVRERLVRERVMAWLAGGFGALAVMLATIGLYGVISYAAAKRQTEIGIRRALGATRIDILRLVLREAAITVAAGIVLGSLLARAAAGSAASLLFGVTPRDLTTYLGAACLLSVVGGIASVIPALRASAADPVAALRSE